MKYYIIAGEASGDLHGANMIKALRALDASAELRIWGGDLMEKAGATLVKHYRDLAFMGFVEVAKNIRTILNNIKFCKKDIEQFQPDALILIDYPGFNLRIAKWAKELGLKVYYYISPQVWAWNSKRVHGMKKSIDRLFVILPFEKAFFQKYDMVVDFVGHPLLDVVESYESDPNFRQSRGLNEKPIIALLPGSRKQEIKRMLQKMLEVAPAFPDHQFVIAGAPSIDSAYYEVLLQEIQQKQGQLNCALVENKTYSLLQQAEAALVTSGTATLETGLFGVPQVVCYTGNPISYQIARRIVNVEYISLVNLILDRPLLKELIQGEFNKENLQLELSNILQEPQKSTIKTGYNDLRTILGGPGASARVAELIIAYLKEQKIS